MKASDIMVTEVITVTPESAPLIVRRASDGKVVYDSGKQLS